MARLIVFYPKEFLCESKFHRKLDNITSTISKHTLLYIDDYHGFISSRVCDNVNVEAITNINDARITHAVIFDDGHEFATEYELFKSMNIPLRRIKINITRVINIKKESKYRGMQSNSTYEYIGRGSKWGNPYAIGEDGDRDEVIRKFEYDFEYNKFINVDKNEFSALRGKTLGCFCKPDKCHGDVIANYLNSIDDED